MEYSEIEEPKFSLSMTGTPNQMDTLITSIEDGLFSRLMFYSFVSEPVWKLLILQAKRLDIKVRKFSDILKRFVESNLIRKTNQVFTLRPKGLSLDGVL
ncbi:MAG: DUF3987 domain-containing protein [Flavobacteriales bacterium]